MSSTSSPNKRKDKTSSSIKDNTTYSIKDKTLSSIKDKTSSIKDKTSTSIKDKTFSSIKDKTSSSSADPEDNKKKAVDVDDDGADHHSKAKDDKPSPHKNPKLAPERNISKLEDEANFEPDYELGDSD